LVLRALLEESPHEDSEAIEDTGKGQFSLGSDHLRSVIGAKLEASIG
jgi:hypothetical protein